MTRKHDCLHSPHCISMTVTAELAFKACGIPNHHMQQLHVNWKHCKPTRSTYVHIGIPTYLCAKQTLVQINHGIIRIQYNTILLLLLLLLLIIIILITTITSNSNDNGVKTMLGHSRSVMLAVLTSPSVAVLNSAFCYMYSYVV